MNKKDVNIYKPKEVNIIKLKEYLQRVSKTEVKQYKEK
tara:strand:+ start:13621 stop:13734 length:114 start_codon:yes stop_codon:yes gene_type:complete